MDLSIIFVNWNSGDYLLACLRSVYKFTHAIAFEVIIVDNASTAPGLENVQREFPEATIIRSDINLGFARANNLGAEHAAGDYILFLNPDTLLLESSIDILVEQIRTLPNAGIVGCKLLNSDLTVQLSSIQQFPNILNQVVDAEYLRLRWPHCWLWSIGALFAEDVELLIVPVIPGACMLMRRAVFERVGRFSDEFFMYAEDLDLNLKLKDAGFINYYIGRTALVHHGGRSSARQGVSWWSVVMKSNAMLQLFQKRHGRSYGILYRFSMGCASVARLVLLAAIFPFTSLVWNRQAFTSALHKWTAVLNWSLGRRYAIASTHSQAV